MRLLQHNDGPSVEELLYNRAFVLRYVGVRVEEPTGVPAGYVAPMVQHKLVTRRHDGLDSGTGA